MSKRHSDNAKRQSSTTMDVKMANVAADVVCASRWQVSHDQEKPSRQHGHSEPACLSGYRQCLTGDGTRFLDGPQTALVHSVFEPSKAPSMMRPSMTTEDDRAYLVKRQVLSALAYSLRTSLSNSILSRSSTAPVRSQGAGIDPPCGPVRGEETNRKVGTNCRRRTKLRQFSCSYSGRCKPRARSR